MKKIFQICLAVLFGFSALEIFYFIASLYSEIEYLEIENNRLLENFRARQR